MIRARACRYAALVLALIMSALFSVSINAQSSPVVPRLVNFSGKATDAQGKALSGVAGATFVIYKDQHEGSPLWLETQNVQADAKGHYTVQLGATKPDGLPLDLFSSGDARWLSVTINGGQEQPRVLLLSVPYALKAADAETIGGLPPSAFLLASPASATVGTASQSTVSSATSPAPASSSNVITSGGVVNALPLWTTATNIQSSAVTQIGTGTTAKVGINTATPASTLDVNGAQTVRGNLSLPAAGTATVTSGKNSQPATLTASTFNSSSNAAVAQNFRWQAEPAGNNTTSPTGTLNLLYGSGTNAIAETGLRINNKGLFTFAAGQTFPGAGTVTSVGLSAPSSDFTVSGSPVTKSGTLKLNWNVAPTSANTANAIVKRDASGNFIANTITAAGQLFATALTGNGNAISGSSNNSNATVIYGGASSPIGATWGVEGETFSSDPGTSGVTGRAHNGGVGVTGFNDVGTAVAGFAGTNAFNVAGVYGQMLSPISSNFGPFTPPGVWGSTGLVGGTGIYGTADDGFAEILNNNSPSGFPTLIIGSYDSSGPMFTAFNQSNNTSCTIDPNAHLSCSGGTSAVVRLDGGKRKVALSAIESPENWFEDFGTAQMINGVAVVRLDSDFIQSVNTEKDYNVFLTPYGDCRGLYVTNRTANSFEVHELGGGTASVSFGYRITAIRRNYENVRFDDHTNDPDPRKMLDQIRKAKPASSPAWVRPASQARARVPVAELTNR